MNKHSKFLVVLLLIFVLSVACRAKSKLELIYSGYLADAQTCFINDGSVYVPNGSDLVRINEEGDKIVLSRDDLNLYMDFGTNLKTIGTTKNTFLLLDENDNIVREIKTFDGGGPVLSKNGEILVITDPMEDVTKIFRTDGTLLWDLDSLRYSVDITDDGKKVITSSGEILSIDTNTITYIPDCGFYGPVHIFGSRLLFVTQTGFVSVYDISGELKWKKKVDSLTCFTLLDDSRLAVYTTNSVMCLNLDNGETCWEKRYDKVLLKVLEELNEADYVVFQTGDDIIHVLDKNGLEIDTKDSGKINDLVFGGNLIAIRKKDGERSYFEVIKISNPL